MLLPFDYNLKAVFDPTTRAMMAKIEFEHGGKEYDDKYPDGIPTSMVITDAQVQFGFSSHRLRSFSINGDLVRIQELCFSTKASSHPGQGVRLWLCHVPQRTRPQRGVRPGGHPEAQVRRIGYDSSQNCRVLPLTYLMLAVAVFGSFLLKRFPSPSRCTGRQGRGLSAQPAQQPERKVRRAGAERVHVRAQPRPDSSGRAPRTVIDWRMPCVAPVGSPRCVHTSAKKGIESLKLQKNNNVFCFFWTSSLN